MLISFREIISKYNIKPTGVFHVGGNSGQELPDYYNNGVLQTAWIEAIPDVYKLLQANCKGYPNAICFNECIDEVDGQELQFNISNNESQSSSLLNFKTHRQAHPSVEFINKITVKTKRLDTLIKDNKINIEDYSFMNFDIQGKELSALRSMGSLLSSVSYLYLEVNKEELYENVPLIGEVEEYIGRFGFKQKEVVWCGNFGWGDAFYINENAGKKWKKL